MDYFALLGFQRSPWIETGKVDEKFRELSQTAHPDRHFGDEAAVRKLAENHYAELNRATMVLKDPVKRLRHYIELETGNPPPVVESLDGDEVECFMAVNKVIRKLSDLLSRTSEVESPILRLGLARESISLAGEGELSVSGLQDRIRSLEDQLKNTPAPPESDTDRASYFTKLERIFRSLSHYSRWHSQLREKIFEVQSIIQSSVI